MESNGSRLETGEGGVVMLAKPASSLPALTLPSRKPAEALLGGFDAATPSPMTFVSSLFAEQDPYADYKSFSQLLAGAMASPTAQMGGKLIDSGFPTDSAPSKGALGSPAEASAVGDKGLGSQGFSGSARFSNARFKTMMPSRLPIPRSPYLTIPPGLSPTTLLDSPVLLSTAQAEPSPTTGTFPLPPLPQESGPTGVPKESSDQGGSFVFKPHPHLASNPLSSLAGMGPFGLSHQQALAQVQAQAESQAISESPSVLTSVPSFNGLVAPIQSEGPLESTGGTELSEKALEPEVLAIAPPLPHVVERPSEDGYNWRKYGQKQVKGSEYPRSYYKCTSPNCPVKKKVERSYEGEVTEIVYKGEHNHAKPQATRRSAMNGGHMSDRAGREASHSTLLERADISNRVGTADRDRSSADPSSSSRGPFCGALVVTPEPSLGSTSDDEVEEDEGSKGDDDDEPDSKRRRIEKAKEGLASGPLRTIREPRVVVQTTSDVDILDDGYRWRKYGQKVVKGNSHPRSYYKCTNLGCKVRKHVERSSTDIKAVITTYEGKHNHDVPAARNGHRDTSGTAATSVSPPPGPGLSTSGAKPSPSLQEQLLGKLLEDRFKAVDKAVGAEVGTNRLMNGALTSEQNSVHGGTDMSTQTVSLRGSSMTRMRPLEGAEIFGQGLGLRPKEEPGVVHSLGSFQPIYASNSSSFVAEGLLLGP